MAGIARSVRLSGRAARAPAVLLSGGETTVTIGKEQA
jgi:hydroxypyruvate reductase